MTAAVPRPVADVVLDEMNAFILLMEHFLEQDDPRLILWDQELDRFLTSHPVHAQLCLARMAHFQGDIENAEHYLERAADRGASRFLVEDNAFMMYMNLLFASRAQKLVKELVSIENGNVREMFPSVVGCGAISKARLLLEQAPTAGLDMTTIAQIDRMKEVIAGMPISEELDAKLAEVVDCAGEVARARKLFWLDRAPRFAFDRSTGCMAIRYRVATTVSDAAQMTAETADLVIERNLVDVPVTIGFKGVGA